MVDTHCHLYQEYYDDLDKVIIKMENNIIIVSGTSLQTNKEVINLCSKYKNVYGTIGIHPSDIHIVDKNDFDFIEQNISNPKIIGIGEIGLDYYWTKKNAELQKEIFIKQIKLAEKYRKTIVIHMRDSVNDTYEILKEHGKNLKKVLHCYSSSYEMAKKFIELGCFLGISGTITFKNNKKLVEVVKNIDLKYLLLETDSPFLTPEPFRGKRNEPSNIKYVANKVAEIKQINLKEVIKITTDNSISQFDLDVNL